MKFRTALLLIPVLLALSAGTALAKTAPTSARLDQSFGRKGVARTATAVAAEGPVRMAIAPGGRVYLLQRELLLAFEADGKPAHEFGNNGRVVVSTGGDATRVENLAVDSQGRVLVVGTVTPLPYTPDRPTSPDALAEASVPVTDAFVLRYLPDGSRDATFGIGGETDTNFGLPVPTGAPGKNVTYQAPVVTGTTITVDSQDRPIVGGSYATALYFCGVGPHPSVAYTARLTAGGGGDPTYAAGKGYALTGQSGTVTAMAGIPGGGVATLGHGWECGAKSFAQPGVFSSLDENGESTPTLDPARPAIYLYPALAIDSQGRALVIQSEPYAYENAVLVRLQPTGGVDTGFGFGGGIPLTEPVAGAETLAVDAKDRALVAAGLSDKTGAGVKIARYTAAGKRDWKFGTKGMVKGGGSGDTSNWVSAIALDGHGRIYTASWIRNSALKTGAGVQITRFLPDR
jgi:uncharacterized delta-60 repeat protein